MRNKSILTVIITLLIGCVCSWAQPQSVMKSYNYSRALEEAKKGNKADAMDFLSKEVAENPNNGYAYFTMALIQAEGEDYSSAMTSINTALKKLPKKDKEFVGRAYASRGHLYSIAGDTVQSLSEYSTALKINPVDTDILEDYGQLLYELKQYDDADKCYHQIITINPTSVMGYMGLGRNAQAQENSVDAITQFDKVIQMYPDYSSGYAFRAESYLFQKDYLKAIDDICKALEIDSDRMAYQLLFKFPKDQIELVAVKLKGLSAREPHSGEYLYYTGLLYAHHKIYDKSDEALKSGYDIDARSCFIQQLAENSQASGNYATALEYVNQAQQMSPDDIDLIHMKADILGESGDIDGAISEWSKYIEKSPDFFGGYYRRGWFKDVSMQTDEAIEDYSMAVMLNPDYAYGHFGLADMLMRKGETDKAKEEYLKVLELDSIPNNESCAMYALLALDRKDEAISYMNRVLENDSTDAGNYYDAACLYSRIGDTETSLAHLRNALQKGFKRFYHIYHDDDLEVLRQTPKFKELMLEYETVENPIPDTGINIEGATSDVSSAPVEIPFIPDGGCAFVKCSINELPLSFIFDTGASMVSLSQVEANFMLKNGYLKLEDFAGKGRFIDANGDISEGTIVNLRNVDFGGLHLENVRASVVRNQKAPLLLGQSVLGRLGSIEIDNPGKKLIIKR